MTTEELFELLLSVPPDNKFAGARAIPGAGDHQQVIRNTQGLRGDMLERVRSLALKEQAVFVKALAVYEDTVGGIGSVTALSRVLPVISDPDHAFIDWVLQNTCSYSYYANRAKSYAEWRADRAQQAWQRRVREENERRRAAESRARKAEQATSNLANAIRRGDQKAVRALLEKGAAPEGPAPDGGTFAEYAEACGRPDIAEQLRSALHARTKS